MAVADAAVHSIAVYNVSHGARQAEFGSYGSGPGQFNYPRKLCFSPRTGNILVADSDNQRVQVCIGAPSAPFDVFISSCFSLCRK